MSKIYLAGPITGITFDDADEWRVKAREFLARYDIAGMSPLRGKAYFRTLGDLNTQELEEGKAGILSKPKAIMARDFYDATTCDVLFVNLLGATRVSIGTMLEIAWAYQLHKPVVCCMEQGNIHEHAMVNEAIGFRVSSLDEGLAVCVAVLNPMGTI